ncbi:glycosyltransferase family 2 protein [Rivibacter subsaxonicus]|uniref:Glycosyltransferase involved in cell wall biosynthesis n=1 Tax=Rivibacter subsaxonicus TaxID=457575 RepID=A0A4Q7W1E0_9BURK|nr:glycosyltransferase family 2 protein [Rivibacter subsaxonicus]RZU03037.1 glycosyltransferase involved in cell wall biosynthesis [Rivibacter subsaxonicus]
MRLSVVLITKNEARHIEACLASVGFADEWIVVDSGSSDGTQELARRAGARVIETSDWPGFGPQKNRALAAASGDWVFSIDADERASPELAASIRAAMAAAAGPASYKVSRLSSFCGEWIRHGDWYPDDVLRLFRRGSARFSDDLVHEQVLADGPVGRLDGELLHESQPSLESCLDKLNRYTSGRALQLHRAGRSGSLSKAIAHGLWAFLRSYVFKRGFLDGRMGFVVAFSIAEGTYYRYLKIWLLARGPGPASLPPAATTHLSHGTQSPSSASTTA